MLYRTFSCSIVLLGALCTATRFVAPPRALYATSWAEVFNKTLEVQGKIPEWIPHGSWVRQGPAIFEIGGRNASVLLDGGAKLTCRSRHDLALLSLASN